MDAERETLRGAILPDCHPATDQEKLDVVEKMNKSCDLKSEPGFEDLLTMCQAAQNGGGRLVLVDVPVARWLKELSPVQKIYQEKTKPYIEQALGYPNVRYVNLLNVAELSDEATFRDGMHPCEEAAESWSLALKDQWPFESSAE